MADPIDVPDPAPIPPDVLAQLFPLVRPPITESAGSFEFALTLAGTVSAGAYTAGVLDFLLEALDAWEQAKQKGSADGPTHQAILSIITGTSGGAINGALFLRTSGFGYPHGADEANPFYKVWVEGVAIKDLLKPDTDNSSLRSLFNTAVFNDLATTVTTQLGPVLGSNGTPVTRGFLADPLRLTMMVANVTGIPYRISFRGQSNLGHDLVGHEDFARFGMTVPGGVPNAPTNRPDEFALTTAATTNWDVVAAAALSTSAFPAAFPSQPLSRPWEMIGYRVAVVPDDKDQNKAEIAQLLPVWKVLAGAFTTKGLSTTNVDGGTVNNEPLDHARTALAGYNARNKRGAAEADRAVVLIDPFSDPEKLGPSTPPGFLDLLGPLVNTLVYQSRMKPEDIALAADYDTYSRFLVAPFGPGGGKSAVAGSSALAAGGLGGFLGFLDSDFLKHDFLLGRLNAYTFLKEEFVLAENHPLFLTPRWTVEQRIYHQVPEENPAPDRPAYYLPIIPLMPALRNTPPPLPVWPRQTDVPDGLDDQAQARLDGIYAALKADLQKRNAWPGGVGGFALDHVWSWSLRGTIRDKIVQVFHQGLNDQNLLETVVQKWPYTVAGRADALASQTEWLSAGAKTSLLSKDGTNWILTTSW